MSIRYGGNRLYARVYSVMTGIPLDELMREFPAEYSSYDDHIVDRVLLHGIQKGASGTMLFSYVYFWVAYGITEWVFLAAAGMFFAISVFYERQVLIDQYRKLVAQEAEA
jgi:hypothetical protein